MSIERELLKRVISGDDDGDFFIGHSLYKDIETFLTQPEQWKPECRICKTTDNVEWVGGFQSYRCDSKDCIPF